MIRAGKLMVVAAGAALLLLYSADCFALGRMDTRAMKCCASMPCTPANQNHDCCKTVRVEAAPYVLPPTASLLSVPFPTLGAVLPWPSTLPFKAATFAPRFLAAYEHAPPEDLSTRYHCLLI